MARPGSPPSDPPSPGAARPHLVVGEGVEGLPSAWLEVGSRGEIRLGVKVYDDNVDLAVDKVVAAFTKLHAAAVAHVEREQQAIVSARLKGRS